MDTTTATTIAITRGPGLVEARSRVTTAEADVKEARRRERAASDELEAARHDLVAQEAAAEVTPIKDGVDADIQARHKAAALREQEERNRSKSARARLDQQREALRSAGMDARAIDAALANARAHEASVAAEAAKRNERQRKQDRYETLLATITWDVLMERSAADIKELVKHAVGIARLTKRMEALERDGGAAANEAAMLHSELELPGFHPTYAHRGATAAAAKRAVADALRASGLVDVMFANFIGEKHIR